MPDPIDLQSKFLGGMLGSALGDAIGELAFRYPTETGLRERVARSESLIYTDDTAMAIGLAESMIAVEGLDAGHLGDTFRANYRREPWRGYAMGPPTIFSLVERRGMTYVEAARSLFGGQGSFGNGAAMRVAPLALRFHDAADLYERVRTSASVTHAHPIGVDGAAVLARAVAQAVRLDPREPFPYDEFALGLVAFARTREIRQKMEWLHTLLAEDAPPDAAARRLGQGVAAHESVPFALYAFLRHSASFEDCLLCAVLNGGDRDTVGAMACGVSGAYLGIEAIPPAWRCKLENRAYIEELAVQLGASWVPGTV